MKLPLKWEFPGGKIESDEEPKTCLQREILEELNLEIAVTCELAPVTHQYPDFVITLYPFVCTATSDAFKLQEHAQAFWLKPELLHSLDWAEADIPVLDCLSVLAGRGISMSQDLPSGIYDALIDTSLQDVLGRHPELRSVLGKIDPEEQPARYADFGNLIRNKNKKKKN